jgi:hypothetical protein
VILMRRQKAGHRNRGRDELNIFDWRGGQRMVRTDFGRCYPYAASLLYSELLA